MILYPSRWADEIGDGSETTSNTHIYSLDPFSFQQMIINISKQKINSKRTLSSSSLIPNPSCPLVSHPHPNAFPSSSHAIDAPNLAEQPLIYNTQWSIYPWQYLDYLLNLTHFRIEFLHFLKCSISPMGSVIITSPRSQSESIVSILSDGEYFSWINPIIIQLKRIMVTISGSGHDMLHSGHMGIVPLAIRICFCRLAHLHISIIATSLFRWVNNNHDSLDSLYIITLTLKSLSSSWGATSPAPATEIIYYSINLQIAYSRWTNVITMRYRYKGIVWLLTLLLLLSESLIEGSSQMAEVIQSEGVHCVSDWDGSSPITSCMDIL